MTTAGAPLAIEATGLEKSFGETRAVAGVDLAVPEGTVYGVLGPERRRQDDDHPHAGHAHRRPTPAPPACSGTTSVTEGDAVRGLVSLTGQLASVDEELTGRENLILLGRLLGLGRAGVKARGPTSCSRRSGSPRRPAGWSSTTRAACAAGWTSRASIVVTPRLMFLDEPTTGLDPRSRNQVWEIVRALVGGGHHDPALHAVPRGGRPARRRDRGHRPRPGHRRGHARPAQGVGRRRRAARAAARPATSAPAAERCSSARVGTVVLEPDPAALSVSCADADRGRARRRRARPGRHRHRGVLARPAEPRRGVPGPHRPPGADEHDADPGGAGVMSTAIHDRRRRRHRRRPPGHRSTTARPPRPAPLSTGADLRLARHAQGQARAGAAARRDHHAGDVPADVHLPVRRRDRRLDRRLPRLHPARACWSCRCCSRPSTPASR